jgi:hypothetical protein
MPIFKKFKTGLQGARVLIAFFAFEGERASLFRGRKIQTTRVLADKPTVITSFRYM